MIVLDGPIGTMLAALGVPTPPPLWSAAALRTHPETIAALHAAYAAAGATVHTAATFRTHPYTAGADAPELTATAIALARGAVPAHHRVAGSLAPLEDCYRPDLSPAHPDAAHAAFARLLAAQGVDLILCESFPHVGEAVAATRAAVATGVETWTSLTPGFDASLLGPAELADGARAAADAGAATVLVNCLPAVHALPYVRALAATGLRWGVYANAGDRAHGLWHDQPGSGVRYAALAVAWQDLGAAVIGSCCGTGPQTVSAVSSVTTELK